MVDLRIFYHSDDKVKIINGFNIQGVSGNVLNSLVMIDGSVHDYSRNQGCQVIISENSWQPYITKVIMEIYCYTLK